MKDDLFMMWRETDKALRKGMGDPGEEGVGVFELMEEKWKD